MFVRSFCVLGNVGPVNPEVASLTRLGPQLVKSDPQVNEKNLVANTLKCSASVRFHKVKRKRSLTREKLDGKSCPIEKNGQVTLL